MNNKKDAIELTLAIHNSLVSIGINKLVEYLNIISTLHTKSKQEMANVFMEIVCSHYKISVEEVRFSQRNDGSKLDALCVLSLLLKKHLVLSQTDIAEILNKHKSQISKYISKMTRLNPDYIEMDKGLYSKYKELEKIITYILSNKSE
jgi:chromosomal replication initiation ATPase DnaA